MYKSQHIITSRHYLFLSILAFAAGIYLAARLGFLKALIAVFLFHTVCAAIVFLYLLSTKGAGSLKVILVPAILILALLCGIFRLYLAETPKANHLAAYESTEAWVFGTVSSEPRFLEKSHSLTFELDVFCINDNNSATGTIIMYVPKGRDHGVHFGDSIRCWAKLSGQTASPDSLSEDYYTRLKGRNIFLSGNTKNVNILKDSFSQTFSFRLKKVGSFIRSKISAAADVLISGNPQNAAILKGILVGDKSGFDDLLYEKFSNAGISHIVAVSGLHISIMFSFLLFIMSGFSLHSRLKLLAVVPFIILFMSASLFTPSVCRASAMMLVMILSSLLKRGYDPISSLAFALGCILISSPYALFSKSLVLSFAATLGIFVYFDYINRAFLFLLPKYKPYKYKTTTRKIFENFYTYLSSSLALSLASFLGTAYFLIVFFGKLSKVQFITNLWVVPVVFAVFCLGYISCIAFYVFPRLATTVLKHPLNFFLEIISRTADCFGSPKCSFEINTEYISGIHTILYFGAAFIIYMTFKAIHDIKKEKQLRLKKDARK